MSYYRTSNTKVSVTQPQTLSDCRIFLTRNEKEKVSIDTSLTESLTKITDVEKQILALHNQLYGLKTSASTLQAQLKQNEVNKTYLTKCLATLETQEKDLTYLTRCKEFINTYEWINPDDGDDGDDVDNGKNELPHDVFSHLSLPFGPLDSFTSDEIIKIAHYLKACELITSSDNDNIPDGYTYAEVLDICTDYDGENVIGDTTGCTCGYHDCSDSYKRYGDVVTKLKKITLDSYEIITNERLD